jgi:hypothetical protein
VTSQTLLKNVQAQLKSSNFEQVQKMKQLDKNNDAERQWQILNDLDGNKIKPLVGLFNRWQAVFDKAYPSLQTENSKWGVEQVAEAKKNIDSLLSSLHLTLIEVAGEINDNAE